MIKERTALLFVACGLIVGTITLRLLPHPANFAPVMAVAIFGGAVLPRKFALWLPLIAMIISDAVIGFYDIMPVIWACYLIVALASNAWMHPPTLGRGIALTIGASIFFFIVTNGAVWLASGMYPHTWTGLVRCYTLALPFFRNSLLSDAVYTSLLFGLYSMFRQAVYRGAQEIPRGAV